MTSRSGVRVVVQIYGVTTIEDALVAASLGADHVGVAVDETGLAPDGVARDEAREILGALPAGTTRVALTLARDVAEIEGVADEVRPEILHVGADLDVIGADEVTEFRKRLPKMRVMRAIPVQGRSSIDAARRFQEAADLLLLDTRDAASNKIGATGSTHDWTVSAAIVDAVQVPVVLAGGLSAENVAAAIRQVRPWGVDSYTLTCVDGDLRRKDPEKVAAFVAAVRRLERRA